MKRILFLLTLLVLFAVCLTACGGETETQPDTTEVQTTPLETTLTTAPVTTEEPKLALVEDGKTPYRIIVSDSLSGDAEFMATVERFAKALSDEITVKTDKEPQGEYEILIGDTNRGEPSENGFYYTKLTVSGKTLSLSGHNPEVLSDAMAYMIETYPQGTSVLIPLSVDETFRLDRYYSEENQKSYADIAKEVYDSFNAKYFVNGWVAGHAYWDKAEMIETYIDVYEATGTKEAKDNMLSYAKMFVKLYGKNWSTNEFNDDIMWACIAYTRIAKLCDNAQYLEYAKTNFDIVWERAYDDVLGGGLYWRIENTTKNSCVNCPGAIAACLLGEMTGDKSYYDKAALLMKWEFDHMFEEDTGRVYDALNVEGKFNKWASTYNQGTFIGACTLLHEYTGEKKYLDYAAKAAEYAMTRLVNQEGIIDNGEASTSNQDLPGFKGILVRWLYRYARYTEDLEILAFLQKNATHVYRMRNDAGIIWTDWTKESLAQRYFDQGGYSTFGMSTAVALMANCQPWW